MGTSCIAHRGASGVAPENTLLAFWSAIAAQSNAIEFDVQITKDQDLVIFHDKSLRRITGESTGIADHTIEELRRKDVGRWKNEGFKNLKIPTFREVLERLPKNISLIVEVKPQYRKIEENRILEKLILNNLDDLRPENGVGNGYISVRDEDTLEWFKSNSQKYPVGLMQKKRSVEEFLQIVRNYRVQYSQIRWNNYSEEDFSNLHGTSTKSVVYFADNPEDFEILTKQKVHGILTNFPTLLVGFLKQRNLEQNDL